MTNPVNQELKQRRSIYALGKNVSQTPAQISETPKQSALLSLLVKIPIVFGISLKLN